MDPHDAPVLLRTSMGDGELFTSWHDGHPVFLSNIEVHSHLSASGALATRELKTSDVAETEAHRRELLQQLNDGKHIELVIQRALGYRQARKRGEARNRNSLRFPGDDESLSKLVASFKNQPFLVDHSRNKQVDRKGTILSGELGEYKGLPSFYFSFNVTKADAVRSVLDGTLDRFSIGWNPAGVVLCTVHNVDVRGKDACYCWPGDEVEHEGKLRAVEFEFVGAEGEELSGVNIPAVKHTHIEEYRTALTAELGLKNRRSLPAPMVSRGPSKEMRMYTFKKLAAALKLSGDGLHEALEDQAVAVVDHLNRRALTAEQELATSRARITELEAQVSAAETGLAAASQGRVNDLLAAATRQGKLKATRDADGNPVPSKAEIRLRRIAKEKGGVAQLEAELEEMPVIVPVGQSLQAERVSEPNKAAPTIGADASQIPPILLAEMKNTADRMGLKIEDMVRFYNTHRTEEI